MISRISGTLVRMISAPYVSKELMTTLATMRHPSITPIYKLHATKKRYFYIYSGYVPQFSLKRRFSLSLDKVIAAKCRMLVNEPLSSAVLSFLFTDLVELLGYLLSEYAAKRIALSAETMQLLIDDILDIESIKLDNYGIVRIQLTLQKYFNEDALPNTISNSSTRSSIDLETYALTQLVRLLLAITFFNRNLNPLSGEHLSLKVELSKLNLCPIYSGALLHLATCNREGRTFRNIQNNEYYQSMMATSYIRRGMHIVSHNRYNVYPLHSAVVTGDIAHVRILHRVCAGHHHSTIKTCLMLALETLIKYNSELSFLHNLSVFVPKVYTLILHAFHLYHIQHSFRYTSSFDNIDSKDELDLVSKCSVCRLLYCATRAFPWQPLLEEADKEKYSMAATAAALERSVDYPSLKLKFPLFQTIVDAFEAALLLVPAECCIDCSRAVITNGADPNEGCISLIYAYQAALECGIIALNSAVTMYESFVMTDIFDEQHLSFLTGGQFYASGRLQTTFKPRGSSHRPMSRPLLRPLSKHRGIVQQSTTSKQHETGKKSIPTELVFAMIHQVPFHSDFVAECSGALDDKSQTALMRAVILDDLYAIHLLVHVDGQVRCQNSCGLTASMLCAIYDHPRALSITLPFEYNMIDAEGWAALTHSVRWMSYDSVRVASLYEAVRFGVQALNALNAEDMTELEDITDSHTEYPVARSGTAGSIRDHGSAQSLRALIRFEIQRMLSFNDKNQQPSDSYGVSEDTCGDDHSVEVMEYPDFKAREFLSSFLKRYDNDAEELLPAIERLKADTDHLQKRSTGMDLTVIIAASRAADTMSHSISRLNGLIANCVTCQTRISELSLSCSQLISSMNTNPQATQNAPQGADSDHADQTPFKEMTNKPWDQLNKDGSVTAPETDVEPLHEMNPLTAFRTLEAQVRLCLVENRLVQAYILLQLVGMVDFSMSPATHSHNNNIRGLSQPVPSLTSLSGDEMVVRVSNKIDISSSECLSVADLETQLRQCFVAQASCFLLAESVSTFATFKNSIIFKKTRSFNAKDADSINSHHLTILNDYLTLFTHPSEAEKTATEDFRSIIGNQSLRTSSENNWANDSSSGLKRTILCMIHHLKAGEAVVNTYLGGPTLYDCATTPTSVTNRVFNYKSTNLSIFELSFTVNVSNMKDSINKALYFIRLFKPYTSSEVIARLNSKVFLWAQDTINRICTQLTNNYKSFLASYTPSILQQSFSALTNILNQKYDLLTSDLFIGLGLATHFRKTITGLIGSLLSKTVSHFELSDLCLYKTYEYTIMVKDVNNVPLTVYNFLPVGSDTLVQLNNGFAIADGYWHDHQINTRSSANISKPDMVRNPALSLSQLQDLPYMELLLCIEQVLPFHELMAQLLVTTPQGRSDGTVPASTSAPTTNSTNANLPQTVKQGISPSAPSDTPNGPKAIDVLSPFVRVKCKDKSVQLVTLLNTTMPVFDVITATLNFIWSIYSSYSNLVDFQTLIPDLRSIFSRLATKIMQFIVKKLGELDLSLAGIEQMKMAVASKGIASSAKNPASYPYNYGYALISTICFMSAAVIPSSANNLRAILKSQLDSSAVKDYYLVVRDLYRCSVKSLQYVINYVSNVIVKDVLDLPELAQIPVAKLSHPPASSTPVISSVVLKIANVFNSSLIRFASTMPYSLMAQIGYKALQKLATALEPSAHRNEQFQVDIFGLTLAHNSKTLKQIFLPLVSDALRNVEPANYKDISNILISNGLFTFLDAMA